MKPIRTFENTLKHIIWKQFETYERFLKTLWNIIWKHTIWKPLKPMGNLKKKHFETHYLKTLWNTQFENHWNNWGIFENTETHYLETIWNTQFENHWNLWGILKTLWNTSFENTLKHIWKNTIWKPLKPMGNFENTFETQFENHWNLWGLLKTLWNTLFENTLKHTIWKPLKHMGDFWKHFETHYLKTLWNTQFENHWNIWEIFENTLKTILIPHWAITTQVRPLKPLVFNWHSNEIHMCSHAWRENLLFSRCWMYRLHNFRVKRWAIT